MAIKKCLLISDWLQTYSLHFKQRFFIIPVIRNTLRFVIITEITPLYSFHYHLFLVLSTFLPYSLLHQSSGSK
jgi:hypothetical protein